MRQFLKHEISLLSPKNIYILTETSGTNIRHRSSFIDLLSAFFDNFSLIAKRKRKNNSSFWCILKTNKLKTRLRKQHTN